MVTVLEILVCFFAVVGIYALFVRLSVALCGKDTVKAAIAGTDKSIEEILLEAELLRLRGEIEKGFKKTVILLEREDAEKENALHKEGFLVYIRK